jgi:hypothetical protein
VADDQLLGHAFDALQIAAEEGIPVLPRGAGSSQCGQTVGAALVIDNSKYLKRIVSFDKDAAFAVAGRRNRDGREECVRVIGQVPHERALGLQQAADGLLLISGSTGAETAKVYEYMAAGKPVVGTNVTGMAYAGVPERRVRMCRGRQSAGPWYRVYRAVLPVAVFVVVMIGALPALVVSVGPANLPTNLASREGCGVDIAVDGIGEERRD